MKEFKELLKEKRAEAGLSQKELGEKIYLSRSTIAKYENGLGLPSEDTLTALCNFFETDRAYFFPQENAAECIVKKNRAINKLKISVIAVAAAAIILFSVLLTVYLISISNPPVSGGISAKFNGQTLDITATDELKTVQSNGWEMGCRNAYTNGENDIILARGGEIFTCNGIPDYVIGFKNMEKITFYATSGTVRKKLIFGGESEDFDIVACKNDGWNLVIANETQEDINIGTVYFSC